MVNAAMFNGFMDLCPRFNGETYKVEAEFCRSLRQLKGRSSEEVLSSDSY